MFEEEQQRVKALEAYLCCHVTISTPYSTQKAILACYCDYSKHYIYYQRRLELYNTDLYFQVENWKQCLAKQ